MKKAKKIHILTNCNHKLKKPLVKFKKKIIQLKKLIQIGKLLFFNTKIESIL